MQNDFKTRHKALDAMHDSGTNAGTLKREIQQMEEEKQQVQSKIMRLKKKVESVPNRDQWLESAKNLRLEQKLEMDLIDRTREQNAQVQRADLKLEKTKNALKDFKAILASSSPDAFFTKMEEECRMNRYLAEETIPKQHESLQNRLKDLSLLYSESTISESEIVTLESELAQLNASTLVLAEKKLKLSTNGDSNLPLFRQQASIISNKKEGTLSTLTGLQKELSDLKSEYTKRQETSATSANDRILVGDAFKRYVSELRGKSTVYKRKKTELGALVVEGGILSRTYDILKTKEETLKARIREVEEARGVGGFHQVQETLEIVSEKKSEVDQAKGKTLEEISVIIQQLVGKINVLLLVI